MNDRCPDCGGEPLEHDEVDIGVGTMQGPSRCPECGWTESSEIDDAGMQIVDLDGEEIPF